MFIDYILIDSYIDIVYVLYNHDNKHVLYIEDVAAIYRANEISAVSPFLSFGFVKSEVWRVLVNLYQVVFPKCARPEFVFTALHQTLVL